MCCTSCGTAKTCIVREVELKSLRRHAHKTLRPLPIGKPKLVPYCYHLLLLRSCDLRAPRLNVFREIPVEILVLADSVKYDDVVARADFVGHKPLVIFGLELLHPGPPEGWPLPIPSVWVLDDLTLDPIGRSSPAVSLAGPSRSSSCRRRPGRPHLGRVAGAQGPVVTMGCGRGPGRAGSVTRTVVPRPTVLAMLSRPPCRSATERAIARPRP